MRLTRLHFHVTYFSCDDTFRTNLQLNTHMEKQHMGRLPCSYPDCDKTFKYKCNLKKHIRVHSSALKAQMNVANNVQYASKQKTFQKTKACEFVLRDPLTLPELNSYNKATDEGLLIDTKEQEKTQKSICTRILKDKVKHTKKSKLYKQTKHSKTDPRETNLHIQGKLETNLKISAGGFFSAVPSILQHNLNFVPFFET